MASNLNANKKHVFLHGFKVNLEGDKSSYNCYLTYVPYGTPFLSYKHFKDTQAGTLGHHFQVRFLCVANSWK